MIVIADTTPINHLVLLGKTEILRQRYGRVIIPGAVIDKLSTPSAPHDVSRWAANPPLWLEIRQAVPPIDSALAALGEGERQAIALAEQLSADVLLMDDLGGRREAQRRRLKVTGTLTVLFLAAERGFLDDFAGTLQKLQRTGFRASPQLIRLFLDRYSKSREKM